MEIKTYQIPSGWRGYSRHSKGNHIEYPTDNEAYEEQYDFAKELEKEMEKYET